MYTKFYTIEDHIELYVNLGGRMSYYFKDTLTDAESKQYSVLIPKKLLRFPIFLNIEQKLFAKRLNKQLKH